MAGCGAAARFTREAGDPSARVLRRRGLASIRVRLTAVATLLTAVAVIGAGALLLRSVQNTQLAQLRGLAEQSVGQAADRLADGDTYDVALADLDAPVFVTDSDGGCVTSLAGGTAPVQCGFGAGGGTAGDGSTTPAPGSSTPPSAPARTDPAADRPTSARTPVRSVRGNESIETTSQVVDSRRYGRLEVSSPTPADQVARSTASVRQVLWYFLPLVIAAVAGATWLLAGRTLRPVESIRREAESISGSSIHRRVPETPADDEIGRLARTMNEMLDRLDHAARRQHQFISDASHELRSPVAAIRADLEVALDESDRADWPAVARAVLQEEVRIEALVSDLLLLASDDERPDEDTDRSRDISNVELVIVEEAGRRRAKPVRVNDDVDGAPYLAHIGPGRLQRAVANLLDNAARYAATAIDLHLGGDANRVVIHVDDDGPGIPVDDRERVFERFARIDDGRARDDGGSGLGLAVVRSIVERADGTVSCSSSPTGGARMTLTLPRAQGSAP